MDADVVPASCRCLCHQGAAAHAGPCRCKYVTWAQEAEAELAQVKAERDRLRDEVKALKDSCLTNAEWADDARAERDRLHALLWQFVDAHQIPAARKDGTDRLLLDVEETLWWQAADAVGYDEQGQ
jgi:hypothetical protein